MFRNTTAGSTHIALGAEQRAELWTINMLWVVSSSAASQGEGSSSGYSASFQCYTLDSAMGISKGWN